FSPRVGQKFRTAVGVEAVDVRAVVRVLSQLECHLELRAPGCRLEPSCVDGALPPTARARNQVLARQRLDDDTRSVDDGLRVAAGATMVARGLEIAVLRLDDMQVFPQGPSVHVVSRSRTRLRGRCSSASAKCRRQYAGYSRCTFTRSTRRLISSRSSM